MTTTAEPQYKHDPISKGHTDIYLAVFAYADFYFTPNLVPEAGGTVSLRFGEEPKQIITVTVHHALSSRVGVTRAGVEGEVFKGLREAAQWLLRTGVVVVVALGLTDSAITAKLRPLLPENGGKLNMEDQQ